ncbi:MAG: hypothetical protein WBW08_12620 [Methyloceanibacter sp.]
MSEQSRRARTNLIPIRIANISQLFHSLDPLNKDTEEFIVSWARELPADRPFKVVVHLPEEQLTLPDAQEIGAAIKQFFAYRAKVIGLALKELLRVGRRSLAIGLTVLILSILASQTVSASLEPRPLGKVLAESLVIFAWVANWRPIEIFLYEWWPIVRRRNLYRRLADDKVELKPYKPGDQRRQLLPND